MPGFPPPVPAVSLDNQFLLRSALHGQGTNYKLSRKRPIEGLGTAPVRSHDFPLAEQDGADGGDDDLDVRVVTIPMYIAGTYATAMAALKTLLPTWAPSNVNISLQMRLPGYGEFYMVGRPRGLDPDLSQVTFGYIDLLARFDALDPTLYFL